MTQMNDKTKREANSRSEQLPLMLRDIENLQEENRELL